jgi:UDP-glucose 4-epimerase
LLDCLRHIDRSSPLKRIDIVWAAGRAGFAASLEELHSELDAFMDVVAWTRFLPSVFPDSVLAFHMMSSAGGLFEGQRFVDTHATPSPLRPYGQAKLTQEEVAKDLGRRFQVHIYRPSSVYGFSHERGRAGLVNALFLNAKRNTVSRIYGGLDTERDYVFAMDIANFVFRCFSWRGEGVQIHLLASGRPATLTEIIRIVQKVLGRPIYLKLDSQPTNASHITYRVSALPIGWQATDLQTGVRHVARQISHSIQHSR